MRTELSKSTSGVGAPETEKIERMVPLTVERAIYFPFPIDTIRRHIPWE